VLIYPSCWEFNHRQAALEEVQLAEEAAAAKGKVAAVAEEEMVKTTKCSTQ
jgi:hypothetical protein